MYRSFFAQFSVGQTFAPEEIQVGGDWAFGWGNDTLTLTPVAGGLPIQLRGRGLSIMRRQPDGSWKFARGMNNMTEPPQGRMSGEMK